MNSSAPFIAGGGWVTRETIARPKARFFGFASLAWLAASLSVSPLLGAFWPAGFGLGWLCAAAVAVQLILVALATTFWLIERPRAVIEYQPNPDCDPRNLY